MDNLPGCPQGSLMRVSPGWCLFSSPEGRQKQVQRNPFPCNATAENVLCKKQSEALYEELGQEERGGFPGA